MEDGERVSLVSVDRVGILLVNVSWEVTKLSEKSCTMYVSIERQVRWNDRSKGTD